MTRRTLAREIDAEGVALHAGTRVRMILAPAASGEGIVFHRRDLPHSAAIPALWSNVGETRLGTVLAAKDGASIAVVEHLMAALAGAEIDDCRIGIDGPEPPILDGDALSYLVLIEQAGFREQPGTRDVLYVTRPVVVEADGARCALSPSARMEFSCEIDFASAAIGRQSFALAWSRKAFRREIAPARTFGFLHEAEKLRASGLARGADLANTLVIDGDSVINAALQRFPDEFVRHKILDAVGDLKLAGMPLVGRFEARRPSHTLNNALLRALFADPANYKRISE